MELVTYGGSMRVVMIRITTSNQEFEESELLPLETPAKELFHRVKKKVCLQLVRHLADNPLFGWLQAANWILASVGVVAKNKAKLKARRAAKRRMAREVAKIEPNLTKSKLESHIDDFDGGNKGVQGETGREVSPTLFLM
jgi:hypothetical protein